MRAVGLAMARGRGAKALPYKARLEYLESSGTQGIDTGIHPSSLIDMSCTFELTAIHNYRHVMGLSRYRDSDGVFGIYVHGPDIPPDIFIAKGLWRKKEQFNFALGERYTATLQGSVATLSAGGQELVSNTMASQNHDWVFDDVNIMLFTAASLSSATKSKVYSAWIDEGGVRVRSFIPVLDNADTPCMYDEVSGEFFYNQGTGSFTAGPVAGGGYKRKCIRRSYRRSARSSARFSHRLWKEVA